MGSVASRAKDIAIEQNDILYTLELAAQASRTQFSATDKQNIFADLSRYVRGHVDGNGNQQDVIWYIRKLMNY